MKLLNIQATRFFQFYLQFLPQYGYKYRKYIFKKFKFKEFKYQKRKCFQLSLNYKIFLKFLDKRKKVFKNQDRFFSFFFSCVKSDNYYLFQKNNLYQQVKYVDQQFNLKDFYFLTDWKMELLWYVLFLRFKIFSIYFSHNIQRNYLRRQRLRLLWKQRLGDETREIQVQYFNIFFIICIVLFFFNFNNEEMLGKILCYFVPYVYYYIIIFDMEDNQELQYNLKFYI